jgi:hypothetical protein
VIILFGLGLLTNLGSSESGLLINSNTNFLTSSCC